jgi:hypothetical protein
MDPRKEERKSRSNKRVFSEMDLSEWGITYKEIRPCEGKQSYDIDKIDQLLENEIRSKAEILEELIRKKFCFVKKNAHGS